MVNYGYNYMHAYFYSQSLDVFGSTSTNTYALVIRPNTNQVWFRKDVDGEDFVLGTSTSFNFSAGVTYTVSIENDNGNIDLYIDNQLLISAFDDTYSSGAFGFGTSNAGLEDNRIVRYDNINYSSSSPELYCEGFLPPFDEPLSLKRNVKRSIPVKMILGDEAGNIITDSDIVSPPVANVLFNSMTYGNVPNEAYDLLPVGSANEDNLFRFDPNSAQWIYNLGTKQFKAPGAYFVSAASGDSNEYTIPNGSCTQYFERLP